MQADQPCSASVRVGGGLVAALWRYPVKSMLGEELNAVEGTGRGLLGDRQFAVVDPATGKVAGAKNPRKWGNFLDFRAAYVEPPQLGRELPRRRAAADHRDDRASPRAVSGGALRGSAFPAEHCRIDRTR